MIKYDFMRLTRPAGILSAIVLQAAACTRYDLPSSSADGGGQTPALEDVARILSHLPIEGEHLGEVYDAVGSSSCNGYDEEYMMSDLFTSPGAGVGDSGTRAGRYSRPLRALFEDYFATGTRSGAADAEAYLESLKESDIQIYWPYSEDWDGKAYPIVTFDPGYGAETNYGYEITFDDSGARVVDSVLVTEAVARERPVWVINRNDDAEFSPFVPSVQATAVMSGSGEPDYEDGCILTIKSFKTLRNYDSWFAGGSEFFVKCGAPDGFRASKDADLMLYTPSVTDFMVKVKRSQVGREIPFNALLLSDYTPQMETIAFLITEDDGGTVTSWKCSATVKYKSKSYGFDMEIPYRDKDDIVWRGELSREFFIKGGSRNVTGRFGDVLVTFRLE